MFPLPLVSCTAKGRHPPSGSLGRRCLEDTCQSPVQLPARVRTLVPCPGLLWGDMVSQPSPGRELGLWDVGTQRWEWGAGTGGPSGEQGGCVVWDSRRSLQLCRCHRNGAARGLAARQCPGLSAARRSPLPPLRGAALQSAKPGSLLLLTVDIVAESVLLRSHPVLGKVFSNSLGPPSMGPGAEPLL